MQRKIPSKTCIEMISLAVFVCFSLRESSFLVLLKEELLTETISCTWETGSYQWVHPSFIQSLFLVNVVLSAYFRVKRIVHSKNSKCYNLLKFMPFKKKLSEFVPWNELGTFLTLVFHTKHECYQGLSSSKMPNSAMKVIHTIIGCILNLLKPYDSFARERLIYAVFNSHSSSRILKRGT